MPDVVLVLIALFLTILASLVWGNESGIARWIFLFIALLVDSWLLLVLVNIPSVTMLETSEVVVVDKVPIVIFDDGSIIKNCTKLFDKQVETGDRIEMFGRPKELVFWVRMSCEPRFKLVKKEKKILIEDSRIYMERKNE